MAKKANSKKNTIVEEQTLDVVELASVETLEASETTLDASEAQALIIALEACVNDDAQKATSLTLFEDTALALESAASEALENAGVTEAPAFANIAEAKAVIDDEGQPMANRLAASLFRVKTLREERKAKGGKETIGAAFERSLQAHMNASKSASALIAETAGQNHAIHAWFLHPSNKKGSTRIVQLAESLSGNGKLPQAMAQAMPHFRRASQPLTCATVTNMCGYASTSQTANALRALAFFGLIKASAYDAGTLIRTCGQRSFTITEQGKA